MRAPTVRCPACHASAIPLSAKLLGAFRANVSCPACGVSVGLSRWPRIAHVVLGELAVVGGFAVSLLLETPLYLVLGSASWFGFGLALPVSALGEHGGATGAAPAD